MSAQISIATSNLADKVKIGWNYAEFLRRKHSFSVDVAPANKVQFYNDCVNAIVAEQGGTASFANVDTILRSAETPATALTSVQAL